MKFIKLGGIEERAKALTVPGASSYYYTHESIRSDRT